MSRSEQMAWQRKIIREEYAKVGDDRDHKAGSGTQKKVKGQ